MTGSAKATELDSGSSIRLASIQTGLPMGTLRAWERRYGFPKPVRRPDSNRRLYSSQDIQRLASIQRAIAAGYRVGDVIDKSFADLERLLSAQPETAPHAEALVERLLDRLVADDVSGFESLLRSAAGSLGHRRFVTDVAQPLVEAIGDGWAKGRLSVRHEHWATECLVTQVRQLLAGYTDIVARPLVLLAALPGERHTLPLQLVALHLVVLGAKPRLLGADTPPLELVDAAVAMGADVVGLTVSATADRAEVRKAVRLLRRKLPRGVTIWLGGAGAAGLGLDDERTQRVTSWADLERAVVRARPTTSGRQRS